MFVIPQDSRSPRKLAVEVRPGNATVDHHALIGYTDNPSVIAQAQALDADPNPGYESFGDYGVDVSQFSQVGCLHTPLILNHWPWPSRKTTCFFRCTGPPPWTPWTRPRSTSFSEAPIQREVETFIMNPAHLDGGWGSFVIPPNQVTTFHGSMAVPQDMSLISVTPHCHLLGQSWEVFAEARCKTPFL